MTNQVVPFLVCNQDLENLLKVVEAYYFTKPVPELNHQGQIILSDCNSEQEDLVLKAIVYECSSAQGIKFFVVKDLVLINEESECIIETL